MDWKVFIKRFKGKWLTIGGNRWINKRTAKKVQLVISKAIKAGCRIVTGGAEGVDHAAMSAYLKSKIPKNHLKIFLPYTIHRQYEHYRKLEGERKAGLLWQTLLKIAKIYPRAIVENKRRFKTYRAAADHRNSLIVKQAQAAVIFSPKGSRGTQDALQKIDTKKISYIIL